MQVYLADNFVMYINGGSIFSHPLFLIPLPPNIGGKWIMYHYIPLGVIIALKVLRQQPAPSSSQSPNNPCLMWVQSRVLHKSSCQGSPKQHGLAVGKGYSPYPLLWRIGLKCKMGIWCPSLVVYPSQFKDTGLCSSLAGYSLPEGFANFTLKYVPTDCLCYPKPIK